MWSLLISSLICNLPCQPSPGSLKSKQLRTERSDLRFRLQARLGLTESWLRGAGNVFNPELCSSNITCTLPSSGLPRRGEGRGEGGVDCKITEAATCFTTLSCIGIKHSLGSQPKYLFLLQQGHQHYLYHSIINIIFTVSIHRRDFFFYNCLFYFNFQI